MQNSSRFVIGSILLILIVLLFFYLNPFNYYVSRDQQTSSTLQSVAQQTTASWPENSDTSPNLVRLKVLESSQQFGRPIKLPATQPVATPKSTTESHTTLSATTAETTSSNSIPVTGTTGQEASNQSQTQQATTITADSPVIPQTSAASEPNLSNPTKSTAILAQDNEIKTTPNIQQSTIPPSTTSSKQEEVEGPESWKAFTLNYGRSYPTREEELKRREIFLENERFILKHNLKADRKFSLGLNHFADHTREEINQMFVGPQVDWLSTINQLQVSLPEPIHILSDNGLDSQSESGGSAVDWRNITAGEPIDQGLCRESSVYVAVASIEAAMNSVSMSLGTSANPLKLSERQVLDCMALVMTSTDTPPLCQGFTSMLQVFDLLQHSTPASMISPSEYQEALDHSNGQTAQICSTPFDWSTGHAKLTSFNLVHRDNIPDALLNNGPLAVALDASQSTFHFYKDGLYHDENCSTTTYNHHALLVGYNITGKSSDSSGGAQSYYLVRNTFGPKWGESGYMRLLKDESNNCLPQNLAISPNLINSNLQNKPTSP